MKKLKAETAPPGKKHAQTSAAAKEAQLFLATTAVAATSSHWTTASAFTTEVTPSSSVFPSLKMSDGALQQSRFPSVQQKSRQGKSTSGERQIHQEGATKVFEITPRDVYFEFNQLDIDFVATISFKNISKENQFIRVNRPRSRFFWLSASKETQTSVKTAPGLAIHYTLFFRPDEFIDYEDSLKVETVHGELVLPLRACASRGQLQLPQEVVIDNCPVKGQARTVIFLRNAALRPCTWRAEVDVPFVLSPCFGTIPPEGGIMPVEVCVNAATQGLATMHAAASAMMREGVISFFLGPEGDRVQHLPVRVNMVELPICLGQNELSFAPTHVTTERQAVVQLVNGSDQVIQFNWKGTYCDGEGDTVFDDQDFTIQPISGVLYGKATREFTVIFNPQLAIPSSATAFLEVTGRFNRLPLHLSGYGRGPECKLEFPKLDLGEVYVNDMHEYKVGIENTSCIEAQYTVVPPNDTPFGSKFTFSPPNGVLPPGRADELIIQFQPDKIGTISETFPIRLHGSNDTDLTLQVKGTVVYPSFKLDVSKVEFGCVPYSFSHMRTFNFTNTSQVVLCYEIRLPPNCSHADDIRVSPSTGVLQPGECHALEVLLDARTLGKYEEELLINLMGFGEAVQILPLTALSEAPELSVLSTELDFKACFVGYGYIQFVEVHNATDLAARIQLIPPNGFNECNLDVMINGHAAGGDEVREHWEVLDAYSSTQIQVSLQARDIGVFSFNLYLQTLGRPDAVHSLKLSAEGCGPNVVASVEEINFGSLPLLTSHERTFTLLNMSPIPAEIQMQLVKASADPFAVFSVTPEEILLEPQSSQTVTLLACLDDAAIFKDTLLFKIRYAPDALPPIALKAGGQGFALVVDDSFTENHHLGDFFTGITVEHTFTLTNKGRRHQEVQWLNVRGTRVKEDSPPIVFNIKPDRLSMAPRESATFTIHGFASCEGTFSDTFFLKQCGTFREILTRRVTAHFITPLITYNVKSLLFEYIQEATSVTPTGGGGSIAEFVKGDDKQKKTFTMKNITGKDLVVELRIRDKGPFSLYNEPCFPLATGETHVIGVQFDPHYCNDRLSHTVKSKVLVCFQEHPHTESVLLSASLMYPALSLSTDRVDFGTILKATEGRRQITLHNTSSVVPAVFEWKLQYPRMLLSHTAAHEEQLSKNSLAAESSNTSDPENNGDRDRNYDISTTRFDFAPFRGKISPGGSQVVDVIFHGTAGAYECMALCQLSGGPSYPLKLLGAGAEVNLHYSQTTLDFGCLPFYAEATQTFTISNLSHVPATFHVDLSKLKDPLSVRVNPQSGILEGRLRLTVTFSPRVPAEVEESFWVHVGHFEPQQLTVCGKGLLNTLAVTPADSRVMVRRIHNAAFEDAFQELQRQKASHDGATQVPMTLYANRLMPALPDPPSFLELVTLEAERLAFCASLYAEPKKTGDAKSKPSLRSQRLTTKHMEEKKPSQKAAENNPGGPLFRRLLRRSSTSTNGPEKYVIAHYVVEFGHLTCNDARTLKLRLTNIGAESLTAALDSKELAKLPGEVHPTKIQNLPSMSSVVLEVTLDVRSKGGELIQPGHNTFEFALDIKGGPLVVVACHCYVATPQVILSTAHLDFDYVLLGQVRIMPLTLTNTEAVSCDWRIACKEMTCVDSDSRPSSGASTRSTERQFWCRPEKGKLLPYTSTMVEVCFAPIRAERTTARIQVYVVSNTKMYSTKCVGIGKLLKVHIHPAPCITFPLTGPFQVSHEKLRFINYEDEPIEIFCANLDRICAEEHQIFYRALKRQIFTDCPAVDDLEKREMMLRVRTAGESLPHDMLDAVFRDIQECMQRLPTPRQLGVFMDTAIEKQIVEAALSKQSDLTRLETSRGKRGILSASKHNSSFAPTQIKTVASGNENNIRSPSVVKKHSTFSSGIQTTDEPTNHIGNTPQQEADQRKRELQQPCAILLLGPPESGKTTQAHHLHNALGCLPIHLDSLVHAEAEKDTANGEIIRNILTILSMQSADNAEAKFNEPVNLLSTVTSAHAALPMLMPKDQVTSVCLSLIPRVLTSVLQSHMEEALSQAVQTTALCTGEEPPSKPPHATVSFVLDDLCCSLTKDPRMLLEVLHTACKQLGLSLQIVSLAVSEATVGLRSSVRNQALCQERMRAAQVDVLSEEAFEALDGHQRKSYNEQLNYLNECRRALERVTAKKEYFELRLAEEASVTIQDEVREGERILAQELAALEASRRSSRRNTRSMASVAFEQRHPEPEWEKLNRLDAFKDLCKYFHSPKFATMLSPELAAGHNHSHRQQPQHQQQQQQQQQAFAVRMCEVGAELCADNLTRDIIEALTSENFTAPMQKGNEHEKNATETAVRVLSEDAAPTKLDMDTGLMTDAAPDAITLLSVNKSRASQMGLSAPASKVGVWSYINMARLRAMASSNPIPFVRFFSPVQREVVPVQCGKKNKVMPNIITRAYEELTRWIIPPHSYVDVAVEFCCDRAGDHVISCTFGIVGTQQSLELTVKARAVLPDICRDEKVIFPVVRSRLVGNRPAAKVLLLSKSTYYFGSLLLPFVPTKRPRSDRTSPPSLGVATAVATSNSITTVSTTNTTSANASEEILTFLNAGDCPCELNFSFLKEKEKTFVVTPTKLLLSVNDTQTVTLRAAPETLGEITNTLVASVIGNPTPWLVNVSCIGSRPVLTVDGKKEAMIEFARTALHRSAQQTVLLENLSTLPIQWRLSGVDKFPPELQLSETSGLIAANEAQSLSISFSPINTCFHQLALQLLVSDANLGTVVYETLPFSIKAEGHDVVLEWTREVDFKVLHVGETKKETLRILNKSPYDVVYLIRYPKRLENIITFGSTTGTIRGLIGHKDAAIASIEVTAHFSSEGEIPAMLGKLEVAFYEPQEKRLLYPLQIVPIRGEAWYMHCTVKPASIDFGSCFYNQRKQVTFELRNTGRFPLYFALFDYREGCDQIRQTTNCLLGSSFLGSYPASATIGAGERYPEGSFNTDDKIQSPSRASIAKLIGGKSCSDSDLVLGCFRVSPAKGVVPIGEVQIITVVTVPEANGRIHETLGIFVPQSEPEIEAKGIPVVLSAHPAIPAIASDLNSSTDVGIVFEEQRVVNQLVQMDRRTRAYAREDRTFTFGTVLLDHRVEERFRIANVSSLPCTVCVQLGDKKSYALYTPKPSAATTIHLPIISGKATPPRSSAYKNSLENASPTSIEGFELAINDGLEAQFLSSTCLRLVLSPFESRLVTVAFTPSALRHFSGCFTASVEDNTSPAGSALNFLLSGEGTLPIVACVVPPRVFAHNLCSDAICEPTSVTTLNKHPTQHTKASSVISLKDGYKKPSGGAVMSGAGAHDVTALPFSLSTSKPYLLQLPLTLMGASSTSSFTVRNVGDVAADIRLSLLSEESRRGGLRMDRLDEDITIPTEAEEVFVVHYEPTRVEKAFMKMRFFLTENPFEDVEMVIEAMSFTQAVSFEGIDPARSDGVELESCFLNQPTKRTFVMRNNTESDLRFTWQLPTSDAVMVPEMGHLLAGMSKTVTLTFTSRETSSAHKSFTCQLLAHSMSLLHKSENGENEGASVAGVDDASCDMTGGWDNSMVTPKWVVVSTENDEFLGTLQSITGSLRHYMDSGRRNLKKVMQPVPEPAYRLTDAVGVVQPLHIGYLCEVPTYELQLRMERKPGEEEAFQPISDSVIHFAPTKLFQKRSVMLRVRNTSVISLPFAFYIESGVDLVNSSRTLVALSSPEEMPEADREDKGTRVMSATARTTASSNPANEDSRKLPPFTVDPVAGFVPPGSHRDLTVSFMPVKANLKEHTATLRAEFPFSVQQQSQQVLTLHGISECPLVHFDIPPSNYFEQCADGGITHDVDPETTFVLEFLSRGIQTRTPLRFKVINPTSTGYAFEWVDHSDPGISLSPFVCLTPTGYIHAGRDVEACFEFSSDATGTRVSRWDFSIAGKTPIPFLLVGKTVDPEVFLSTSKVHFGCVTFGSSATQKITLENRDTAAFHFSFDSLYQSGLSNVLTVKPMAATVGPKEKVALLLTFTPQEEMVYNMPLLCDVKKSTVKLSVNIKGEGVCLHDSLYVEDSSFGGDDSKPPDSGIAPLARACSISGAPDSLPLVAVVKGQMTSIDMGRVHVNTCASRRFILMNSGKHPFDFAVIAPERRFVYIEGCRGTINAKQRAVVTLTYKPTVEEALRSFKIRFKVNGKPAYQVNVQATAYVPKLLLNFERYNFGPRFIQSYTMNHYASTLFVVTNNDKEPISVELSFSEHSSKIFLADATLLLVRPNDRAEVTISFRPQELRVYEDKMKLLLNGTYSTYVPFIGEGVIPRVEVINHFAKLGVTRVGEKRQVEVKLECRSRLPTPVSFASCLDQELIDKGISVLTTMTSASPASLTPGSLDIPPLVSSVSAVFPHDAATVMLLKPHEVRSVLIVFKPPRRMGAFQHELRMLVCGREFPFAIVSGACEDSEIHLDTSILRFEDIMVGSSATRQLTIMNSGDISQKFTWNGLRRSDSEISVHPKSAFVRAHTEFICEVTYAPLRTDSFFQRSFEITFDDAPTLTVMVEANAIGRPLATEVLNFRCRAREKVIQNVLLENLFDMPWCVEPAIDNTVWSAPAQLVIKPRAKALLPITYAPMVPTLSPTPRSTAVATSPGNVPVGPAMDLGTLFVPHPDGTGRSYTLEGRADPAGPAAPMITVEIEANVSHTLTLTIRNWTAVPLRFVREVQWVPEVEGGVISLQGASTPAAATVEVPPMSNKECAVILTCVRHGSYHGTITFVCLEKPEMQQYFNVTLRVLPALPDVISTTELHTAVRTCATHHILVSNPLSKPVSVSCTVVPVNNESTGAPTPTGNVPSDVLSNAVNHLIVQSTLQVPAKGALSLPVQFVPLLHKDYAPVKVVLSSADLGIFNYLYKLSAAPPQPEKPTHLVCPLGQSIIFLLRFTYFGKTNTEFVISMDGSKATRPGVNTQTTATSIINKVGGGTTFKVQATGEASWPKGQDVSVEFVYEPQAIGTATSVIEIKSPVGGVYTFPIVASCTEPRRQGPFLLKPGSTIPISFKNVFAEPITVSIVSTPPNVFIVNKKNETIAPKKTINIVVQCKLEDDSSGMHGKLIISCIPPGSTHALEWIHYLEVNRVESSNASKRPQLSQKK